MRSGECRLSLYVSHSAVQRPDNKSRSSVYVRTDLVQHEVDLSLFQFSSATVEYAVVSIRLRESDTSVVLYTFERDLNTSGTHVTLS